MDRAVLNALLADVFDQPGVRESMIESLYSGLVQDAQALQDADPSRQVLQDELARVEAELAHYAGSIAKLGPVDSLLSEIKVREDRRATLTAQLKKKKPGRARQYAQEDLDDLRGWVEELFADWRMLLSQEPGISRAILRDFLTRRIRCTPDKDDKGPFYRLDGQADLQVILRSATGLKSVEIPRGF